MTGGDLAAFGSKRMRFDTDHFRLFTDPAEAVALPKGTCVTLRTSLAASEDLTSVRFPLARPARRLARRIKQDHLGEALPVTLEGSELLRDLDRELGLCVREMEERIDELPGRARYKRIDTYLRLERARDYIETHFAEDPSTERLAEEAAISRAHFIRLFGAFYGVSPKQRVLELKVGEAKRLLKETRMSIWEVAEASGFGNRCAFQRMFRDRVGMTPGRFRMAGRRFLVAGGAAVGR
ncbi:MAG: AraC family transcriptional regulator [Pseudomonadota bacterium]